MLLFAPVGYRYAHTGEPGLAVLTGVVMLWFAMLPDVDHRLPIIDHRGGTHSLLFAALIGGLFGSIEILLTDLFDVAGQTPGMFGFLLGVFTVSAHLVGDALTPAGVPLFWPLPRRYSVSITRADNTVANYALLAVGLVATGGWVMVAVVAVV